MGIKREMQQEIESELRDAGSRITSENYKSFSNILNRQRMIRFVEGAIDDSSLLAEIATRSYTHSLGFRKIVLLDGRDTNLDYKLRLHIWWPQKAQKEGAPIAEGKHEHRWDFVSTVLAGMLENQKYIIRDLTEREHGIFQRFEETMRGLAPEKVDELCIRLDNYETTLLVGTDSRMPEYGGGILYLQDKVNLENLKATLRFTEDELLFLTKVLFKYSNERIPGQKTEIYKPVGPMFFEPQGIAIINQGTTYFHPISVAHRLFIDPSEFVSTAVLTGPIYKGRRPGEFVHSSAGKNSEDSRARNFFTIKTLEEEFNLYLQEMRKSK